MSIQRCPYCSQWMALACESKREANNCIVLHPELDKRRGSLMDNDAVNFDRDLEHFKD